MTTSPPEESRVLSPHRIGFGAAFRQLRREIRTEGEIIRTLFLRNFRHRFAGSSLGVLWVVVMPCLPVFIYNLLQLTGVFAEPEAGVPRSVFLSYGIVMYFAFSETLNQVAGATLNNRNYVVESGVPKMAIILSVCAETAANFLIRFAVFVILAFTMTSGVGAGVLLMPLLAVPLVLLGLTLGLLCNLFCVVYRDLGNIVQAVTFYLLFASGVFAELPDSGAFFRALSYSPIYQVILHSREVCLEGAPLLDAGLALNIGFCLLGLPFAVVAFYRAEKLVNAHL